jgi:hypothetical protein
VHADQEHVQAFENSGQVGAPTAELDDVLDDQVIARVCERRQTPMEPGEEPGTDLVPPVERPTVVAPRRDYAGGHQLVGRNVQKRFVQRCLQPLGQRGLT